MPVCKLCNSTQTKLFLELRNKQFIFKCNQCQNAFTDPGPGKIDYESEDFHSQFNYKTTNDLPRQWKNSLHKQLRLIQKYVPKGANILEIGCGQGLFLSLLKNSGYNVFGVEPSRSASLHSKSIGLNVTDGYYPCQEFENIDFQLIIMSHVLEHMEQPVDFLNLISKKNPGSYLLLIQTNFEGFVPAKQKMNWYAWLPEQHYWHFTPNGIRFLSKSIGNKCEEIEYSTLEHGNYWLSRITEFFPKSGDQFHALIKIRHE